MRVIGIGVEIAWIRRANKATPRIRGLSEVTAQSPAAGIGLSWYTWLEQGREINVSQDVLESLARVMRLSAEEKNHLFLLALQQPPAASKPEMIHADVQAVVQHFLEHWADCPAYVTDRKWDVLAWNRAACAVFGDFSAMNGKERNAVWRCFRSASYRELLVDWEGHAKRLLASFRSTSTCYVGEDWYKELVQELIEHSNNNGGLAMTSWEPQLAPNHCSTQRQG